MCNINQFFFHVAHSPMQENSLKWPLEKCFKKYIIGTVLEMKIWIYWSESNSLIYLNIKTAKMYWSEQSFTDRRSSAHFEDCPKQQICLKTALPVNDYWIIKFVNRWAIQSQVNIQLIKRNMSVNEHDRLSNFTLRHKLK